MFFQLCNWPKVPWWRHLTKSNHGRLFRELWRARSAASPALGEGDRLVVDPQLTRSKANIAAFGGDPSRVLIFGESAGAGSVAAHLLTPLYDTHQSLIIVIISRYFNRDRNAAGARGFFRPLF